MTEKLPQNKIFFFIEQCDKNKYIGFSKQIRERYGNISKVFRFSIDKDKVKYGVTIYLTEYVCINDFDGIAKYITDHFGRQFNVFYKSSTETEKYTYNNIKQARNIDEKKRLQYIDDDTE